jgi:hypothetical protein
MQEHIRRAHPEHYIPKLPATEESFVLMISSPPSERPAVPPTSAPANRRLDHAFDREDGNITDAPRSMADYPSGSLLPAASAAAALAQLHNHKMEPDWNSEAVSFIPHLSVPHTLKEICQLTFRSICRTGLPTMTVEEFRDHRSSCHQSIFRQTTSQVFHSRA